jgi:hypothetical protein
MKALLIAVSFMLLTGCDSDRPSLPTGPTTVPAGPVSVPVPAGRETGPVRINPTPLAPGAKLDVTVRADDPHCFVNWDATGACRQFEVTMPADGTLVATMTLPGPDRGLWNPDVFIAAPNGEWLEHEFGRPTTTVSMPAHAGLSYLIVVMSYGPFPDVLPLSVAVR